MAGSFRINILSAFVTEFHNKRSSKVKFYDYVDVTSDFKNSPARGSMEKVSREDLKTLVRSMIDDELPNAMKINDVDLRLKINMCNVVSNSLAIEDLWTGSGRPYYDVYPSVSNLINELNLNFYASQLVMPHGVKALLLKFYEDHTPKYILFSVHKVNNMTVLSYVVDKQHEDVSIDLMQFSIGIEDGSTIEHALKDTFDNVIGDIESEKAATAARRWSIIVNILKIISSICLIGDNPDLVDPQILSKDLHKLNKDNLGQLLDKAKRRGKFGFSFGKSLDQIPHLRRPHMYWQAYGPKHSLRRYRTRKGSVIHKDKITNVPTGFEENESVHT